MDKKEKAKIYYQNNRERLLAYKKQKHIDNKDLYNSRAKAWSENNPDKIKNGRLLRSFGITLEQYNEMLRKQDYKCAICDTHKDNEIRALAVDHCHTTGKIRGLLCTTCNRALGLLKDNSEILEKAVNYVKSKEEATKDQEGSGEAS